MLINDTFDDATPLVEQQSWTKNTANNVFIGELDLNVSAMNTYIGSSDSKTAYFEIEITESTCRTKIYRATITLKQGVAQPTTTSPDPTNEYYTVAQQKNIFPMFRMRAGEQLTFQSPDGAYERTLGVSNDGQALDIIAPT